MLKTKSCKKCNQEKSLTDFSQHRFAKGGYENTCKSCKNEYNRAYRAKNPPKINKHKKELWNKRLKDGFYSLYYLPKEKWIGISVFPHLRTNNHENLNRNTEGYICIYKFLNKEDAGIVESLLHLEGYKGEHPKHLDFRVKQATSYHIEVKNKILKFLDGKPTIS